MHFQRHNISLIISVLFTLACIAAKTGSNVANGRGEQILVNGCPGIPGRDGRDGRDGIQGPYGPPGLPENVGMPAELERKFFEMLASVADKVKDAIETGVTSNERIEQIIKSCEAVDRPGEKFTSGGATYVRWGRNVCPPKTVTLYSGIVAGSSHTHSGSGANHLCLSMEPQWNITLAGLQSGSRLYGTEFELSNHPALFRNNAGVKSLHNHDAQCAVCQTPGRLTQLMIPARLECPSGWNREYLGFLMSEHYSHERSEYVCVDQDLDVDPNTSANKNGRLFYPVEVVCGSLPCPPYVEGYEVTCVVCSQ